MITIYTNINMNFNNINYHAQSNGKLQHVFILSKTAPGFLSLRWNTCLWAELQFWFLSLQWRVCPWKEYSGVRKATRSYSTYPSLQKLQPGFLSLRWNTCLWAELQLWFLSLQWRVCPWKEYSGVRKATGSYRTYPSLQKLQLWFLSLQWRVCPWGEYSDDDYDDIIYIFSQLDYVLVNTCFGQMWPSSKNVLSV